MRRLQLQLASEILRPAAAVLALLCVVLVGMQLLRAADLVLGPGARAADAVHIALLLAPHVLGTALPIAFLAGTLMGLGRLAEDRELLALASAGIDPLWLLPVPLVVAGVLAASGYALGRNVEPHGLARARALARAALERNLRSEVRPGVFFEGLSGMTLYAERVDQRSEAWGNVLVGDTRDGQLLALAQTGRLASEPSGAMSLSLGDGEVHRSFAAHGGYSVLRFARGRIQVLPGDAFARRAFTRSDTDALDDAALARAARAAEPSHARELWTALARRAALPLAPLAFVLVAVPLGARLRRGARMLGLSLAVGACALYYVLARAGVQWGDSGALAPMLGAQLANVAFAAMGLALILALRKRA